MSNRGGRFNALTGTIAGLFFLEQEALLTRPLPPGIFPELGNKRRILVTSTESFASGENWYQAWRNADPADAAEIEILYESDFRDDF